MYRPPRNELVAPLYYGRHRIHAYYGAIPDEILVLFKDEDWYVRPGHPSLFSEEELDYGYSHPGYGLLARLDMYGETEKALEDAISAFQESAIAVIEGAGPRRYAAEAAAGVRSTGRAVLAALLADLCASPPQGGDKALRKADLRAQELMQQYSYALNFLERLRAVSPRLLLRLAISAAPDAEADLSLTGFVAPDSEQPSFITAAPGPLCARAVSRLSQAAPAAPPVVVLTEGSTDTAVIRGALALLEPRLADLFLFLEPDASNRPERNASALAKYVKAFAAVGTGRRVIAVFDNDVGGIKERQTIKEHDLPGTVRVVQLPHLELATDYPALVPPKADQSTPARQDVNGHACGIEMYFGEDVLRHEGVLEPVLWSGGYDKIHGYQGSLLNKDAVQQRFWRKLKGAEAATEAGVWPQATDENWRDLRAVLRVLVEAAVAGHRVGEPDAG